MIDKSKLKELALAAQANDFARGTSLTPEFLAFTDEATPAAILELLAELETLEKLRKLCDGGKFDLTDSPKSFVSAVTELLGATSTEPAAPTNSEACDSATRAEPDGQHNAERAAFEKWAGSCNFLKFSDGSYVNGDINKAWGAWEARAALATAAQSNMAGAARQGGVTCDNIGSAPAPSAKPEPDAPDQALALVDLLQRWASWIVRERPKNLFDHACVRCVPHGDMLIDGFSCTYHEALDTIGGLIPLAAPSASASPAAPTAPKMTIRDGIWWPEGYCTDPDGHIVPPAGRDVDFKFGYDIGYAEGIKVNRIAQFQPVPQDWQVVPKVPTDKMAAAAIGASLNEPEVINGLPQYAAMLAAAPAVPVPVEQDDQARDAARYRWLRESAGDIGNVIDKEFAPGMWEYRSGEELDAAIDAAMAAPSLQQGKEGAGDA